MKVSLACISVNCLGVIRLSSQVAKILLSLMYFNECKINAFSAKCLFLNTLFPCFLKAELIWGSQLFFLIIIAMMNTNLLDSHCTHITQILICIIVVISLDSMVCCLFLWIEFEQLFSFSQGLAHKDIISLFSIFQAYNSCKNKYPCL